MTREEYLHDYRERNINVVHEYVRETKGIEVNADLFKALVVTFGLDRIIAYSIQYFDLKFEVHTMIMKDGRTLIW